MGDEAKPPMTAVDKVLHFLGASGAGVVIGHVAGLFVAPGWLLIAGAAVGYAGGALAASMFKKATP
jgi:hypothetical protein